MRCGSDASRPRLDERPPALLAKAVSAVDACSDGRAVLAIRPEDNAESVGDLERLGEALEVCRALLRVHGPSFAGRFFRLDRAFNEPRVAHADGGVPVALELPSSASDELTASLIGLAARFAELCVLECAAGTDPVERAAQALELLAPLARRAGRAGGPSIVARLAAAALEPAAIAELVAAVLEVGVAGVVVDWSSSRVGSDDVATVGKLVAAHVSR